MGRRLKVLVSAYACSPLHGSEPAVGWGIVRALSRYHDLWVITEEEKFRSDVEGAIASEPELGAIHFHFVRKERHRRLRRFWPPSYYWYYRRWHQDAFRVAQRLHRDVQFDLAHQLTMVGFREPGYLWRLGIPFVWGPVGGMGSLPWRFLPGLGLTGGAYFAAANVVNMLQTRFLPRPREAARAAGRGLILATAENSRGAQQHWGCTGTLLAEVGLPHPPARQVRDRGPGEPLRIIWSGLHVSRKALGLGLEALAQLPPGHSWELHVLGEGPMTRRWKELSVRLGIAGRCRFHGWLPRDQALQVAATGHLMLITSLRDLTSTVTVEALAQGLPIVCLDHCGFSDAVDASCGIRVPVERPSSTIRRIAEGIARLEQDEPLRRSLASGALKRAADFSWQRKAEVLNNVYAERIAEQWERCGQSSSSGNSVR